MSFKPSSTFSRTARRLIALAVSLAALPCAAQTAIESSNGPAPLLEQISRQSQALHQYVAASLVRVRLPDRPPQSEVSPAEELLRKWEPRLEPSVKQTLMEQAAALRAMRNAMAEEDPLIAFRTGDRFSNSILVVRPIESADLARQMPLGLMNMPQHRFVAPATLGVVMDDHGLVLVPSYVDRDWAGDRTLHVMLADGPMAEATFIGSDRQTGVTLLRLNTPVGHPAQLADARPADGSLVMTFATQGEGAHLSVWTAGSHEIGLVVLPDGRIAGFANDRQFLSAPAMRPVIRQLADYGTVRRSVLGVRVSELRREDPAHALWATANQPAMHIDKVQAGSPAERSGLRQGDLILSIAGEPVGDVPSFAAALAARAGRTEIRISRDGQTETVLLDLARN